ncbi:MFS transporter [Acidovorax citrulli]|nr:MFS transporter [Paracidovorax citrulli]
MKHTMKPALTPLRRWALLAVVGIGLLMVALDVTILYTALPSLARELHATSAQGLWIINAYPLVTAGLLLGAGTLGDRIGHRSMYLAGLVIFGVASFMAALSPTADVLIAARVFQAIGAAAMMPATLALIRIAFENERERNLAISVWASLSLVGAVLGPLLGGVLLQHYWWGAIFLINLPIVVLAIAGTWLVAPRHNRLHDGVARPWDGVSSLQVLVVLSALVAAIKECAAPQPSWPLALALLVMSAGAAALFIRRQSRLAYPLLDFSLFRNPAFTAGVLAAAFVTFATGGLLLSIAQRFQWVAGFTPLQAGLLVSAIFLGTLPSGLLGGAFLHRVGLRWLLSGGLAVGGWVCCWRCSDSRSAWSGWSPAWWWLAAVLAPRSRWPPLPSWAMRPRIAPAWPPPWRKSPTSSAACSPLRYWAACWRACTRPRCNSPDAPEAARQGMAEALEIAKGAGAAGGALFEAAAQAFEHAYQWVMVVAAVLLFIGALVTARLLRCYGPGTASASAVH